MRADCRREESVLVEDKTENPMMGKSREQMEEAPGDICVMMSEGGGGSEMALDRNLRGPRVGQ